MCLHLARGPRTHGEIMACFGGTAHVGDELWEMVGLDPDYAECLRIGVRRSRAGPPAFG